MPINNSTHCRWVLQDHWTRHHLRQSCFSVKHIGSDVPLAMMLYQSMRPTQPLSTMIHFFIIKSLTAALVWYKFTKIPFLMRQHLKCHHNQEILIRIRRLKTKAWEISPPSFVAFFLFPLGFLLLQTIVL